MLLLDVLQANLEIDDLTNVSFLLIPLCILRVKVFLSLFQEIFEISFILLLDLLFQVLSEKEGKRVARRGILATAAAISL